MAIFASFESETTKKCGTVTVPQLNEEFLGGHAMCAVGFDDERQVFIVQNSWGTEWGDHGFCYVPYELMTNERYVYDIWTFRNGPVSIVNDSIDLDPNDQVQIIKGETCCCCCCSKSCLLL